jgi:site-specific recombinase XerD
MAKEQDTQMIAAYLEHLRRAGRSPDTITLRRGVLARLHRHLAYGVGETTDEELAAWVYDDKWPTNTQATYLTCLRSFYRWAARGSDPWLDHDPTAEMESIRTQRGIARPCTDDELRLILAQVPDRIRLWSLLAAYQGLRCCEISGLDREHVSEQRLVVVRGKGGAPRVHDTDPLVWSAVQGLPPGPVARNFDGGRASADNVSARIRQAYDRIGLGHVTAHMLRHWMGVTVQATYRDARVTQELLGHASLNATSIYTRATLAQQREARAMLPRLAGG